MMLLVKESISLGYHVYDAVRFGALLQTKYIAHRKSKHAGLHSSEPLEEKYSFFPGVKMVHSIQTFFCCSSALGNPAACRAGPARGCIVPANKACYKCVPWVNDAGCMVWREVGRWETASNEAAAANGRPFFSFRQPSGSNTPLRSCTCPAPLPSAHSIRVLLWIIMLGCA